MAKKKAKPSAVSERSKQRKPAEAAPNLFERLYTRKRFDILGKKGKNERQHGRSVHDAADKRNKTLLVEYRQLRKANAFIDRRFGEDDESLTAEEKAIARFQKQRMKDVEGDKFALNNGQEEEHLLTHMGHNLGEDTAGQSFFSQRDDEDGHMDKEMTEQLHFGGSLLQKTAGSADADAAENPDRRRTKKEVMEEVMAKSKKYKAEKQQQREEDLNETEALDNQFKALQSARLMAGMARPPGKQPRSGKDEDPLGAAFDVMRRELVFDAKAKVSERTMTAEELAAEEQQRLQRLEMQRLKRLRGPSGDDLGDEDGSDGDADETAGLGGFAGRRAKRRKRAAEAAGESERGDNDDFLGSELEDSDAEDDGEEEEDGEDSGSDAEVTAQLLKESLQARQAARAAGDHPLQQNLRSQAAELLAKYGLAPAKKKQKKDTAATENSSEEDDSGEEASDDAAENSESDKSDDRLASEEDGQQLRPSSEEEGQDASEEDKEQSSEEADFTDASSSTSDGALAEAESSETASSDAEDPFDVASLAQIHAQQTDRQRSHAQAGSTSQAPAGIDAEEADDIPFTIEAPASYPAFAQLVKGRSASQLQAIVQRIRTCNAIALATENRRKLQVFYGIVVQHFANLASEAVLPMAALDVLTRQLLELTAEVPYYAATVARARLLKAHQRLQAGLASSGNAWPGARDVMLLQLWATLFPVSDRRHPVTTPLLLLATSYLALCPVTSPHNAAIGLIISCLTLRMAAPAQRLSPEPLTFATTLLFSALPANMPVHPNHRCDQQWLLPAKGWSAVATGTPSLSLTDSLQRANASAEQQAAWQSDAAGLLLAALGAVDRASAVFAKLVSFPELFAPAVQALTGLSQVAGMPTDLKATVTDILNRLQETREVHIKQRQPLVRKPAARAADIKQFNPQFEEEYVAGKDYDPDRERAEQKRLKRQLNKERRGAMRELRKDAVFLSDEKDKEKAQEKAERAGAYQKAVSFLQQQEADFKSGGQGGMWKKGKKGRRN